MTEKNEYTTSLPLIPKDYAYEDYFASVLNLGGHYLERGIHKRSKKDIPEPDIVASRFTETGVGKTISEIKSGGWGFPGIFKVRGWLDYLGLRKGVIFSCRHRIPIRRHMIAWLLNQAFP